MFVFIMLCPPFIITDFITSLSCMYRVGELNPKKSTLLALHQFLLLDLSLAILHLLLALLIRTHCPLFPSLCTLKLFSSHHSPCLKT